MGIIPFKTGKCIDFKYSHDKDVITMTESVW